MNNYRMSFFSWEEACSYATRLRRTDACNVMVSETNSGYDVTWSQK